MPRNSKTPVCSPHDFGTFSFIFKLIVSLLKAWRKSCRISGSHAKLHGSLIKTFDKTVSIDLIVSQQTNRLQCVTEMARERQHQKTKDGVHKKPIISNYNYLAIKAPEAARRHAIYAIRIA